MPQIKTVDKWFAHRSRRMGTLVDTIVLHATAGASLSGALDTLRARKLSYHYIIAKDGAIWKLAPVRDVAFHAGASIGPKGAGVNEHSIGVCFVNLNNGKDPYTAAQLESCEWLLRELKPAMDEYHWLCSHWAITVTPKGTARKTDPRGFALVAMAEKVGLTPWKSDYAKDYTLK